MALAHIRDATLPVSSLALAHIADATLPTSSLALAHIRDATLLVSSLALPHTAAPEKKTKSPIFLFSPCGEAQIHQKTRHPETASFYSWRSQKRANTSEK